MKYSEKYYKKFAKNCYKKLEGVVNTIIPCGGIYFMEKDEFIDRANIGAYGAVEFKVILDIKLTMQQNDDDEFIKTKIIIGIIHELKHLDQERDNASLYIDKQTKIRKNDEEALEKNKFEMEVANDYQVMLFVGANKVLIQKLHPEFHPTLFGIYPYLDAFRAKNEPMDYVKFTEEIAKIEYKRTTPLRYYVNNIDWYILLSSEDRRQELVFLSNMCDSNRNIQIEFPEEVIDIKRNEMWLDSQLKQFNKAMFRWVYEWRTAIHKHGAMIKCIILKPEENNIKIRFTVEKFEHKEKESFELIDVADDCVKRGGYSFPYKSVKY